MRHSATSALFERRDVIIVASVSCIYGLGNPHEYKRLGVSLRPGMQKDRDAVLRELVGIQYSRNDVNFTRSTFRAVSYTHLDVYKRQVFAGRSHPVKLHLATYRYCSIMIQSASERNRRGRPVVGPSGRSLSMPCLLYTSIMKYVGATDWFIRWPFVIEGMTLGLIGSLIAAGLVAWAYNAAVVNLAVTIPFFPLVKPWPFLLGIAGWVVLIGTAIGVIGSTVSLRRFLRV